MATQLKCRFGLVLTMISAGATLACFFHNAANGRESERTAAVRITPKQSPLLVKTITLGLPESIDTATSQLLSSSLALRAKAPEPKQVSRDGIIVIVPGYPGVPARLLTPDGDIVGELPFDGVYACLLSPDGKQMAALVREQPSVNAAPEMQSFAVYVAAITAKRKTIREPLAVGLKHPVLAWAPDGNSLYVSTRIAAPKSGVYLRPAGVTVYDLAKETKTADEKLNQYYIAQMSVDGKRLLARRVVTDPTERCEAVVLDAVTREPIDLGAEGIWLTHFLGERMLGTRPKPKGKPDEKEFVIFDPVAKKTSPILPPKEIPAINARITQMLPSPDGKRLLYVWVEEVPAPVGKWPLGVPCYATRLTICDLDGGHARTVFKPQINERQDELRNHVFSVDWR